MNKLEYKYKTKNTKEYSHIKLGVYYEVGGYNYFTLSKKPRCYYLGARAVNIIDFGNGHESCESMMFDDSELAQTCQNVVIEEVARYNSKKLDKLFNAIDWEKYGEAIENKEFKKMQNVINTLRAI